MERALRRRDLAIEQRRVDNLIREEVALRTIELEREQAAMRDLAIGIAETLIKAMEAKDVYLRGHSQRVAEVAVSVASELGLDEDYVEDVRTAARLHDVGKIGIQEAVLNKPGRLTDEEYDHVKQHVEIGYGILQPLRHIERPLQFILDHHERPNGSGYPRGISGESITLGGRILAAADAFDALTSRRAYREPMGERETLDYLLPSRGTSLNADVYDALCRVVRRRRSRLVFIDDME